jgi:3-methylfumaryl-CoA hydratase
MTDSATPVDLAHLRTWTGQLQTTDDSLRLRHAQLMAATINRTDLPLADGAALPPLWHWLYFLEGRPPGELGRDGHPARGGFLPPVPLTNRMWAGGRLWFDTPLPVGAAVQKRSQVLNVEHKQGRSGDLVFVTVQHEVWAAGQCCVREQQDLVYKNPSPAGLPGRDAAAPAPGMQVQPFAPDATMLFRYSALTFNGHRIHYDLDYCRQVEGYDNLVIHGPLSATLLALQAAELAARDGRRLRAFSYRGVRPAILGLPLTLNANPEGRRIALWAALADGQVAMQAEAELD